MDTLRGRIAVAALIVANSGFLGFLWGRSSKQCPAPAKAEAAHVADKQEHKEEAKEVAAHEESLESTGPVKITTRWFPLPVPSSVGGCPAGIERIEERGPSTLKKSAETSSKSALALDTHALDVSTLKAVIEKTERWSFNVLGGLDLGGRKHFGVSATMRLVGPVQVGATVIPTARAGLLSLGVTF